MPHLHNIFPQFLSAPLTISSHNNNIERHFLRQIYHERNEVLALGPSLPRVPYKGLYEFWVFLNTLHKRKKNYSVFVTLHVILSVYS